VGTVKESGREGKTGHKKKTQQFQNTKLLMACFFENFKFMESLAQIRKKGHRKKTEVGTEQEKLFRGKAEMVKCYMKESVEIIEVKSDICGCQ
jgi:hypothetical protein